MTGQSEQPDQVGSLYNPNWVKTGWRVAVIANLKESLDFATDVPEDADAEFDRPETIQAIRQAIESDGHQVIFLPADPNLPWALRDVQPDICFNLAEGFRGDAREAQVPALLELLGIPYTGSRVLANALSLEKALTKRVWRDQNLPVVPFQEFSSPMEPLQPELAFPLFVKPSREGSGMGIDSGARVTTEADLRERVAWILGTYHQTALVENYLPGREFTVSVLGGPHVHQISPRPYLYDSDGYHRFPISEIDSRYASTPGVYGHELKAKNLGEQGGAEILIPARLDAAMQDTLQHLAQDAHRAIGALDISRVDFRCNASGLPYLLEINTLPGLSPGYSDLCLCAEAEGLPYPVLILEILYLAAGRFGLLPNITRIVSSYS